MTTTAHLYRAVQDEETGELLLGAQVSVCVPGTQQPITVPFFSDAALTQQMPNPFTCDDGYIDIFLPSPMTVALVTTYGQTIRVADYLSILPNAENVLTSPSPVIITNTPGTGQTLTGVDSQTLQWTDPVTTNDDNIIGWFMGFEFALSDVVRDSTGAVLSAAVTWPDGHTGTYTADVTSTEFPGRVDAWHITWGDANSGRTYFQPQVTRDVNGALARVPAPVVVDGFASALP